MRLGDAATFINGYPFKPSDWSNIGLPIIRIQNLTESSQNINYYAGQIDKRYLIQDGDVLISWSASLGVYEWENGNAWLNQHIFKVKFDKIPFEKSFFKYVISAKLDHMSSVAHGATMKHVTKKNFDEITIPYPPLLEQRRLAEILSTVNLLIEQRKHQIEKLDLLAKSRFIEMFGDPTVATDTLTRPMPDICEIIDGDRGKNYPTLEEFSESGFCLFLNAKNVTDKGFQFENCMFITEQKDSILRKGKLQRGDVVLTTRGTLGNLAFYDKSVPYEHIRINSGMVILRMNHSLISEIFFMEQFRMQLTSIKQKIASGSAQPQLPINTMNQIRMIVPPLALQNEFAAFIEQLDKSKFTIRKSLEQLETLYRALLQEYFG